MYAAYYSENYDISGTQLRSQESEAVNRIVEELETVKEIGAQSDKGKKALHQTLVVWSFLLEDLSNSNNDLPDELRANLISIGIYVIKEIERIRVGESQDIDFLIEINKMIRNGLNQ